MTCAIDDLAFAQDVFAPAIHRFFAYKLHLREIEISGRRATV
jgi:hypothetical protein